MSRVGKRPIAIPSGVTIEYENREFQAKGPKGEIQFRIPEIVELEISKDEVRVTADYLNDKTARSMMGTIQSVLQNMVTGVSEGFTRRLQLVGVGYRATVEGKNLELLLGFSHPVRVTLPEGVTAEVDNQTLITLSSHDKVRLGQIAANIRSLRPPEPYQGKGVLYENERVRRKAGKAGAK